MAKLPFLAVSELFYASYFSYYVMLGGVGLALFVRNRQQFFHYVSVVSFVFYICYAIYIFVPVIGPRVFFREIANYSLPYDVQQLAASDVYPEAIKAGVFYRVMALIYALFEAPGAALPSSHVAIAITTVFFSFRYLRPIRYLHLGVVLLLCLSTIYCRYHYALDVVAGAATAAILIPLANRCYTRFANV
jgi:membrane-associated phospholipid phosphatase